MNRLEHHIERDLRQIADRATPSPNAWTSILTRIANQPPDTETETETETEIIMLTEDTPTSTRRWLPLASAAAAVVAIIGAVVIALAVSNQSSDDDQNPSPVAGTTDAPTATVEPITATGSFSDVGPVPAVTFLVPAGWNPDTWAVYKASAERDATHLGVGSVGVNFTQVTNIYADGCQWVRVSPQIGPTVDDLVTAWANVPGLNATAPVDVTVDGYVGKQIEFTVPDYEENVCRRNQFGLWQVDGPGSPDDPQPNHWAQGPNQHNMLWILDVDGTRVVIDAFSFPGISAEDQAALDDVVASIQIG